MIFDAVVEFFLGSAPDEYLSPVAYNVYFVFKLLLCFMLFSWLIDMFRSFTKFFGRG